MSDPNPFRFSPDPERSESATEAPSEDAADVNALSEDSGSPMSDDDDDGGSSSTSGGETPTETQSEAMTTTGETQA
jgi:hypothetical protein